MNAKVINIDSIEKELPPDVEMLGEEDLYSVPFSMLGLADEANAESDDGYQWTNPRRLGQIDGTTQGRGFDKQDMQELYNDIKDEGLMFPLIARWVLKEDALMIQVLDGERRWRCMDRQLKKEENVWSRKKQAWLPASEVHAKISCRIIVGNDKEALKIAFMVSDRSVNWGEGATAKLIKKLRKCACTDEEILELTKKSFQWLREMDEICSLDELTFTYLTDGRINRALGLRLAKIEELPRRHRYLHASYDDAVSNHQEELAKADEDLNKAESKEEIADAELSEAQIRGDTTEEKEATSKLEEAQDRTQTKRRQRQEAARPRAKTKNLRNAAAKIAEEEEDEAPAEDVTTPLRPGKIRTHSEVIADLISKEGKDEEGKEIFSIATLHVIQACYKAILAGEEDILKVLKRQRNVFKLNSLRKNVPPADIAADMEDDELEKEGEILGDRLEEDDDVDENE